MAHVILHKSPKLNFYLTLWNHLVPYFYKISLNIYKWKKNHREYDLESFLHKVLRKPLSTLLLHKQHSWINLRLIFILSPFSIWFHLQFDPIIFIFSSSNKEIIWKRSFLDNCKDDVPQCPQVATPERCRSSSMRKFFSNCKKSCGFCTAGQIISKTNYGTLFGLSIFFISTCTLQM